MTLWSKDYDYNYIKICCQNQHTAACVCLQTNIVHFFSPETLSPPPRGASLQETSALEQICPHTERYKHRHMAHVPTESGCGGGYTGEQHKQKSCECRGIGDADCRLSAALFNYCSPGPKA